MNKTIKLLLIPITALLLLPLIFSIFNLLKIEIHPIIILLSIIVITFATGLITGKTNKYNGLKNGLLIGLLTTLIFILLSLILGAKLTLYSIIYYLIIIISTTLGSIIGVNKKSIK